MLSNDPTSVTDSLDSITRCVRLPTEAAPSATSVRLKRWKHWEDFTLMSDVIFDDNLHRPICQILDLHLKELSYTIYIFEYPGYNVITHDFCAQLTFSLSLSFFFSYNILSVTPAL